MSGTKGLQHRGSWCLHFTCVSHPLPKFRGSGRQSLSCDPSMSHESLCAGSYTYFWGDISGLVCLGETALLEPSCDPLTVGPVGPRSRGAVLFSAAGCATEAHGLPEAPPPTLS